MAKKKPAKFDPFSYRAGATALSSVWTFTTRSEFEAAIRFCEQARILARSGDKLREGFVDDVRSFQMSSSMYNPDKWDLSRDPWDSIERDEDTHRLAANFYREGKNLLIDVAAALGLTGCHRLHGTGDELTSADAELDVLAARRTRASQARKTRKKRSEREDVWAAFEAGHTRSKAVAKFVQDLRADGSAPSPRLISSVRREYLKDKRTEPTSVSSEKDEGN